MVTEGRDWQVIYELRENEEKEEAQLLQNLP